MDLELEILNCAACDKKMIDPITLSCGYTICLSCFPSKKKKQNTTCFPCTARKCKEKKHLFGPTLLKDTMAVEILKRQHYGGDYSDILVCSICIQRLKDPITSHCGHTFCKTCLLLDKLMMNDVCRICLKRLPSYQFIQDQPINLFIASILNHLKKQNDRSKDEKDAENAHAMNDNDDDTNFSSSSIVYISLTNSDKKTEKQYKNIPIYLTDFTILPSQRLHIPITDDDSAKTALSKCALYCLEHRYLCFAILAKDKATQSKPFGTIAKIETIECRDQNQVYVSIIGIDRFQAQFLLKKEHTSCTTTTSILKANIKICYELTTDTTMICLGQKRHWDKMTKAIEDEEPVTKLACKVYEFIDGLSQSKPSTSFCNTIEGMLGPVWLRSAQALHGRIPSPTNPAALCWWTSIVLPISNSDRYRLLETESLDARLHLILSWIHELELKKIKSK